VYNQRNEPSEPQKEDLATASIDYAHPEYYQAAVPQEPLQPTTEDASAYPSPDTDYQSSSTYAPYQIYHNPEPYTESDIGSVYAPQSQSQTEESELNNGTGKGKKGLAGIGAIFAAIFGWLLKFKSLAFLLKFGAAGFSALISAGIYAIVFGWPFAIGLVISLFIHEMGHALVMKLKGIPIGSLVFIPLLGAAVTMSRMPQNAKDEAEVGIAGPIAGGIAASACFLMAHLQPQSVWAPLAYFGFFINLLNLIPVVPLDGGRVLAAVDRRLWIVGFVVLGGYQVWSWIHGNASPWLLIFVVLAAFQIWSRGLKLRSDAERAYYDVPLQTRILITILYFGLAIALFLGMDAAHALMPMMMN
jgi:Zn-dependent protease